jgi:hypothetical protein
MARVRYAWAEWRLKGKRDFDGIDVKVGRGKLEDWNRELNFLRWILVVFISNGHPQTVVECGFNPAMPWIIICQEFSYSE